MEKNRKIELLNIAEALKKKLESYESQTFLGFLGSSSKTYYLNEKSEKEYFSLLYYSTLQVAQVINGGKAGNEGYKKFIKEELKISKKGDLIVVGNSQFARMNMEELAYLFGWLRRLQQPEDKNRAKGIDNRQSKKSTQRTYSGDEWKGGNDAFSHIFK